MAGLDDLVGAAASLLLGGFHRMRRDSAAAAQRLTTYREGGMVMIPIEVTTRPSPSLNGKARRYRFEIRVSPRPKDLAFGWWNEKLLGDPVAALLATSSAAPVAAGQVVRAGRGLQGEPFAATLQADDWRVLERALMARQPE